MKISIEVPDEEDLLIQSTSELSLEEVDYLVELEERKNLKYIPGFRSPFGRSLVFGTRGDLSDPEKSWEYLQEYSKEYEKFNKKIQWFIPAVEWER